jgi:hypothetical protein
LKQESTQIPGACFIQRHCWRVGHWAPNGRSCTILLMFPDAIVWSSFAAFITFCSI